MGTPDLSPEIVTKLKDRKGDERSVGFISSDGIVALLEDDQISWVKKVIMNSSNFMEFFTNLFPFQLEHSLFALHKLDVNQDGEDELVFSSWDGTVRILNTTKF